jgi:hypothetical protein
MIAAGVADRGEGLGQQHEQRDEDAERRLEALQDEYDDGLMTRERYIQRRDRLLARLERAGAPSPKRRLETMTWDMTSHTPSDASRFGRSSRQSRCNPFPLA